MKTMKKIVAILAVALMLCSILPLSVMAADTYAKITTGDELTTGKYVMVVSTGYAPGVYDNKWVTAVKPTISNDTITDPSGCIVTLTVSGSTVKIQDNSGNYLKPTAGTNTIGTGDYSWTWTCSNGKFIFADSGNTVYLASNKSSSNKFRGYKKATATGNPASYPYEFTLYKLNEDSEPEVPSDCEHEWELISTTAATCTAAGEEYYECANNGCGESKTEAIAALGHSYGEAVETVAPDCVNAGEKESTCSVCGDVKTEAVKALGHDFSEGDICSKCDEEKPLNATITFDADKTQRTEYTTTVQKWENDGLTLTNNKASSTTNIGDYSNPGRFYKSSQIIIEYPGMISLVIDATGINADYLWETTLNNAGLSFTVENKVYTITFAEPTDSITLTAANQARANSITAYGAKKACEHVFDNNCDNECNNCGEANPDYAEHVYDNEFDVDCNVCGAVRDVVAPLSNAEKSISEDVNGYAVKFDCAAEGFGILPGTFVQADYTNATYNGYKLVKLGVIASNGTSETNIEGLRMYDLADGVAKFAFRIINIPADKLDVTITMTPYYVVEIDGVETTLYGEDVIGSYAEIAG